MARKKGYGSFTPARRMALRRAALESARKRRKHQFDKPAEKKGLSTKQKVVLGGALAAGVVGAGLAVAKYSDGKTSKNFEGNLKPETKVKKKSAKELRAEVNSPEYRAKQAQIAQENQERIDRLYKAAGNTSKVAESQEEWDARVELYGDAGMIGEFSSVHEGRAEIFPTLPLQEVQMEYAREAAFPSMTIHDVPEDDDGYVTLYHRTGGGKDLDGQKAKDSLLKDQEFKILNRDEKRVAEINIEAKAFVKNTLVWTSNKLNDSNTRAAFGETVVKVRVPKNQLTAAPPEQFGTQSFGTLSPGELWLAIDPRVLKGAIIEDIPASEIKPPPERKFRAPR